jgi:hypothetical protein
MNFWDCFNTIGVLMPIRGYEFIIYTGDSAPVACRQPRCRMYESPILQNQIEAQKSQGLLEYDDGPWAAKPILAAKPHQEEVYFKNYIWRMAINYRRLNQVTKPF